MIRLSQAHARLMYRDIVKLQRCCWQYFELWNAVHSLTGGFEANVDDIHNLLYVDPMTLDFSPTADIDFLGL
jgi:hypothetical protein